MTAANYELLRKHITDEDEGLELDIPVKDEMFAGVKVTGIHAYVDKEGGFGVELSVLWDETGLDNKPSEMQKARNETGFLRWMPDIENETGKVIEQFYYNMDAPEGSKDRYSDSPFNKRLHKLLENAGFSTEAAESVGASELGMQDVGRASYDVGPELIKEICEVMGVEVPENEDE